MSNWWLCDEPRQWLHDNEPRQAIVSERHVWVVRYGDYWPPEVDSFWHDISEAEQRCNQLIKRSGKLSWQVEAWLTDGSEPPARWNEPTWRVPVRGADFVASTVNRVWIYPATFMLVSTIEYYKKRKSGPYCIRRLVDDEAKESSGLPSDSLVAVRVGKLEEVR